MFYSFIRVVARVIVFLINGNTHYQNKEALPDGPYVLVGPHRTWWDPIMFALAASPRKFAFMAKEELFRNPILRWILVHANAFGVDRAHPGPSVVKTPVKMLRQGELSVMIFPSGSRYANELKGGAALIAKLAKVPIVPAVYQGPVKFSQLLLRKRVDIRFGDPIPAPTGKLDDEKIKAIGDQMQVAFDQLDKEINPDFHYVPDESKYLEEKSKGKVN
ncbi:lysophospholipid acyltransferase family protein [Lacticaseibacillus saniviri]|uniref:Acyltransferase family protein n=1 Tax=Lacticaseibacillus saniviri JCM 17471 = DSM 24301 TaxID=1293598 RepID=A0A0R2MYF0_9LACO|nr:1-acyl-sn-glycerol-3-phosphate acyltransferase [Lacticaseibacillus saniviri]KRO18623.1 acyltransferase family protein [Lacticaseibacillus saniviri JCM 17471 = DSM 24301]MCG4282795.1 1-acyl-sn-glycerol-3-phosphate acyltransferase [Lacticaseibacillus saniviri]